MYQDSSLLDTKMKVGYIEEDQQSPGHELWRQKKKLELTPEASHAVNDKIDGDNLLLPYVHQN